MLADQRIIDFCADPRTGKRMAFASRRSKSDVYLAELRAHGAQLARERRFKVDERTDWPGGWTRNGNLDVFRQSADEEAPEILVAGPDDKRSPPTSPDGEWILYLSWPRTGCCVTKPAGKLMRVRASGGAPEPVFDVKGYPGSAQVPRRRNALSARGNPDFRCPSHPGEPCVLAEMDGNQVIFTASDPVKGPGGEVARFDSPVREVAWGPGGDSFPATIFTTRFCSLLRVSMNGDVEILRRITRSMERPAMSPDGRRLAFA